MERSFIWLSRAHTVSTSEIPRDVIGDGTLARESVKEATFVLDLSYNLHDRSRKHDGLADHVGVHASTKKHRASRRPILLTLASLTNGLLLSLTCSY